MPTARLVVVALTVALLGAGAAGAASPGDAVYRKLCRSIQARHVRALFTMPVAPIQLGGSSDCAFHPRGGQALLDGVRVFLRIDDGDKSLWDHRGDRPYGRFRTLSGAGRQAKWGYQSGRLPSVVDARKGTFTCTVMPSGSGSTYATGSGTPLAAARAYAGRLVALCADVFAAYRQ
jgi:hypothetical protein